MIVITGATGQLGRLVIASLLRSLPASEIVAAVRNTEKAADLAALGVHIRQADYSDPASLDRAFSGANKVLLISSNEIGQRTQQHQAVIDAAKRAAVDLLAYTSLLHAERSPLALAAEHVETEQALQASGLNITLLRNGWYTENFANRVQAGAHSGVIHGAAGDGRIAAAARRDYADAAAAVLIASTASQAGRIYELGGDEAFTLHDLAVQTAAIAAREVVYHNVSEHDYRAALVQAGLPEGFAVILADADTGSAHGALFDDSHELSALIGRPTTPLAESVAAILAA